ncbi:pyridoxamine 5'-phosphate oxidase family protein [Sedimenticola sp.]|uniref:pyridoxamine 5'-phosphate oxidase family protein n=1 Tax=Sedimenticola sp. TaxID=1940285 RepID=UPI003D107B3C
MPRQQPDRNRINRHKERGHYDTETIHAILDQAKICHVGFNMDGQPFVIPMAFARQGNSLLLHGAPNSRLLGQLASGFPVCVTITHLDGLVLARSTFHHSMNFRSVVAFGTARPVNDLEEKHAALIALTEHLTPGRTTLARAATDQEVMATAVVRFEIEEASAKVRRGPPLDSPKDRQLDVWAGVIPIHSVEGEPIPAPDLKPELCTQEPVKPA